MDPAGHQVSRWQRNRDQPLIRIASAGSLAALLDGPRRRITPAKLASRWLECQPEVPIGIERDVNVAYGSKADIGEMSTMSPLYPNKRTSTDATGMSA